MKGSRVMRAKQSLVQKILQRHLVEGSTSGPIRSGDYVSVRPWRTMTHDNSHAVIQKFNGLGAAKIHDPKQIVFTLDHDIQNKSEANLSRYAEIEAFAKDKGVDFYPAGRGIGHQVMIEELYAEPGSLCVASDSHSNMYGGVGCLGTPIVRTDAASIWCTGRTWWRVPPVVNVELKGQLPAGCSGKDVIIALCGFLNEDQVLLQKVSVAAESTAQVLNHAVEFSGDGVTTLTVEDRLTIANMSTEWGALCGLFPADSKTLAWWAARAELIEKDRAGATPLSSAPQRARRAKQLIEELEANPLRADADAEYVKRFVVDLDKLSPLITGGNSLKDALVAGAEPLKIHKAWLVSCVNARASDIKCAANELRGRKVADHVEFYIAAASSEVQADAQLAGDWQVLVDAGAIVLPPGCGACAGLGAGTIKAGERGIASTNRNFKGRMGDRDGVVYLASPAVVAASAAEGRISAPSGHQSAAGHPQAAVSERVSTVTDELRTEQQQKNVNVSLVRGFPKDLEAQLLWCGADNISTDGIYHGKHMYNILSAEEMAEVSMENYDPSFVQTIRSYGSSSPILAAGDNFGCGSSREQAAQCFRHLGIPAILAGSYSATYIRNALNNGLPIFESPELAVYMRERFGAGTEAYIAEPTVNTSLIARLKLAAWTVELVNGSGKTIEGFPLVPVGAAAQELVACGGLEPWIAQQLAAQSS